MKFNKLIPELSVSNSEKSLDFYTKVLGFKLEYKRKDFAFLSLQGSQIMISRSRKWQTGKLEHPFGRGVNFQIEVKNIEPLVKALQNKRYPIMIMPQENWYRIGNTLVGNKEFLVMDPDGYLLRFAQYLERKHNGKEA